MKTATPTKFKETDIGLIPEEWKVLPIYELAQWINGLAFKNIQFSPSGKPVIKINELKYGITAQTQFTDDVFDENYHLKKQDLLFSWSGSPDTSIDAFWYDLPDGWLNQHIFKVKPRESVLVDFLYYILKSYKQRFVEIARDKQTTGLGHVTIADIKRFYVALPSISEQAKIAEILSSLDDKIELNQKMNANLEKLAAVLFKKSFVDIGDDLPEGWRVTKFTDVVDVLSGGTPKTSEVEYWGGDIPFFTPKDAGDSAYTFGTEKYITLNGLENCNSPLYPTNTTFITARGTVGKVAMAGVPMSMNQSCYALKGKNGIGPYFVYELTKRTADELRQKAHGSVFSTITIPTFAQASFPLPDSDLINKYETTVSPFFEGIRANCQESAELILIRDSLLSRLMSGKIRVNV